MNKKYLVSLAAVAALIGTGITPAGAVEVNAKHGKCSFTYTGEEVAALGAKITSFQQAEVLTKAQAAERRVAAEQFIKNELTELDAATKREQAAQGEQEKKDAAFHKEQVQRDLKALNKLQDGLHHCEMGSSQAVLSSEAHGELSSPAGGPSPRGWETLGLTVGAVAAVAAVVALVNAVSSWAQKDPTVQGLFAQFNKISTSSF